jgi:ribosome-associated heat shock protein Hsp15
MTRPPAPDGAAETSQRLDKWLWFARLTKSRTLAAAAIDEGKIKVNRVRAGKASQTVKIGDVITSRLTRTVRVLRVAALGVRRGPAPEARQLYEDLTPQPAPSPDGSTGPHPPSWGERGPGTGRPTKRERRLIEAFKGRGQG